MIAYVLLRVFLILLLVAANAFFAAAEFSLVSVRDTRIQQLIAARRIGARIVQKLHRNLDEVVNGVQLGITIVSLTLGWVGEPVLAQMMMGPVRDLPHASVYAHGIAIFIAFGLITCLHVILGELVPKSLALQRSEQVALAVAGPMDVFLTLTRPLSYVMSRAAGWVLRALGSRRIREGAVHSPDELKLIVTASRQFGEIPPFQEEMIHHALELDNITVREVMVPRPAIFSLPGDLHDCRCPGPGGGGTTLAGSGLRPAARPGAHCGSALCPGPDALDPPAPDHRSRPAGGSTSRGHENQPDHARCAGRA